MPFSFVSDYLIDHLCRDDDDCDVAVFVAAAVLPLRKDDKEDCL